MSTTISHSPVLARILKLAEIEAERDQAGVVDVHHLLVAISQEGGNIGSELLEQNGLTLNRLRALDFEPKAVQPKN